MKPRILKIVAATILLLEKLKIDKTVIGETRLTRKERRTIL